MRCGAVVPAAGSSRRMGAIDKILEPIAGRPPLLWVLDALASVSEIEHVILAVAPKNAAAVSALAQCIDCPWPVTVCPGGATRQESVAAGVARLQPEIDLVLVHDAARPLVTPDLVRRGIQEASRHGAVVAALPTVDTVKRVGPDGAILATLDRRELYSVQTPQVFRRDWLEDAYRQSESIDVEATDEASLLEWAGYPVHVYPGDPENLKLTRPVDLAVAGFLLARRIGGSR